MKALNFFARAPWGRRLAREESGATAIEFALVIAPFLALVLVIMEAGLNYYSEASLETALRKASRSIMTGKAQERAMSAADFKSDVCAALPFLMKCENVTLDVRTIEAKNISSLFGTTKEGLIGDVKVLAGNANVFCIGVGGSYVVVRAMYVLPTFFSFATTKAATIDGNHVYIVEAAGIFRNEPFSNGSANC